MSTKEIKEHDPILSAQQHLSFQEIPSRDRIKVIGTQKEKNFRSFAYVAKGKSIDNAKNIISFEYYEKHIRNAI